ncbi:MAG TPA: hypothetical protein VGS22_12470 [Thermoanaerobaculia bacterium]|jgi:tetratricopeptide (TPR) repeat protein|nr:hypothetical protein [Thermoanaerobaculia bacterium]
MDGFHVTRNLLRAIHESKLPPRHLVELAWKHLLELCPHCRMEWEAWVEERREVLEPSYDAAFSSVQVSTGAVRGEEEKERQRAQRDFRDLLALPHDRRREKIHRANKRFKGAPLAELLLAEARERFAVDPKAVWQFAETASWVLLHAPLSSRALNAKVRASAYMGNALRADGDLPGADRFLAQARRLIRSEGVTATEVYAEVDLLEGGLRKDQRRLKEAEVLLSRAASLYHLMGESLEASRTQVVLGYLYYYQGKLKRAIATTRRALGTVPPEGDAYLYLCARHNLALFLCESGAYAEAAETTREDAPFYARFGDRWQRLQLHQDWLYGKIAAGLGHLDEAEGCFTRARDGFLAESVGYDVALVSLDLALVLLEQGRVSELKELATILNPVFVAEDLHQEAVSALLLFQKAALHETLSREIVEKVAALLKELRESPALRLSFTA